ncbi:hypothetical protein ACIBO5_55700 [Nonomuraea angiospora]|uniref:hypothetical protein n=1 Tax=Nonomuraea angiospora TaxID=46172 RepID=UPI0037A2F251
MYTAIYASIGTTDMVTRAAAATFGTLLILSLGAACASKSDTPAQPTPKITADTSPITDSGPYWCDVFPQQAIRKISGLTIPLEESIDGVPATHGGCILKNEYTRFSLNWSTRGGDEALELARKNFGRHQLTELPADLGEGLVAYTRDLPITNPYVAFILFRCGDKRPWMGIDFSEVAAGRNVVTDSIELLRIARNRYGKLHNCSPKGT